MIHDDITGSFFLIPLITNWYRLLTRASIMQRSHKNSYHTELFKRNKSRGSPLFLIILISFSHITNAFTNVPNNFVHQHAHHFVLRHQYRSNFECYSMKTSQEKTANTSHISIETESIEISSSDTVSWAADLGTIDNVGYRAG